MDISGKSYANSSSRAVKRATEAQRCYSTPGSGGIHVTRPPETSTFGGGFQSGGYLRQAQRSSRRLTALTRAVSAILIRGASIHRPSLTAARSRSATFEGIRKGNDKKETSLTDWTLNLFYAHMYIRKNPLRPGSKTLASCTIWKSRLGRRRPTRAERCWPATDRHPGMARSQKHLGPFSTNGRAGADNRAGMQPVWNTQQETRRGDAKSTYELAEQCMSHSWRGVILPKNKTRHAV